MTKDNLSLFSSEGTPVPFDCLQGRVYGLSSFRRTRTQIQALLRQKGRTVSAGYSISRLFPVMAAPASRAKCGRVQCMSIVPVTRTGKTASSKYGNLLSLARSIG